MLVVAIPPSVLPDISPSRGEIRKRSAHRSSWANWRSTIEACLGAATVLHHISPLEGEMSGRTEGGKPNSHTLTHARYPDAA
jgi:hypothetical protein